MSPAKQPKGKKGATATLTIDFSGISTLVWNRKQGTAEVRLVDLASAGFQRHYAALGLVVTEDSVRGVKGPDADAVVSLPGDEDRDVGLWNLLGTEVEIVGASGNFTVDNTKVDVTKKPGKKADSVQWLPNVGFLTDSNKADPICPTASTVKITSGHITALAAGEPRKVEFLDGGVPVAPARYCLPRFRVAIPFDEEIAIRLDRRRVLRFSRDASLMISNTCVCGLGVGPPANHFYAHYDVVQAKRRPTVQRAGPQPMVPWFPEYCFGGFVEV